MAERLSANIVLKRRLPPQFHRLALFVTPSSGLRYYLRNSAEYDPMLYRIAERLVRPGSTVWDVGANVGLFSFCAAALSGASGYTVAIEPDAWLCSLIARSSRENSAELGELKIENVAVGAGCGMAKLGVSKRSRAFNQIGSEGVPVEIVTLDALLQRHPVPTVLKIDVESYEVEVLKGATKLLREHRPAIWCEVDHANSRAATEILHGAGYELFSPVTDQRIESAYFHTLAFSGSTFHLPT